MTTYRQLPSLLALAIMVHLTGCEQTPPGKGGGGQNNTQPGLADKIQQSVDIVDYGNDLRQIHTFYKTYEATFNYPPRSQKEFVAYIKKDAPALAGHIEKGYFVILPNVKGGGTNIVAYQNKGMHAGVHLLIRANNGVDEVPNAALMSELKGQP
jgi:hypothetical protein